MAKLNRLEVHPSSLVRREGQLSWCSRFLGQLDLLLLMTRSGRLLVFSSVQVALSVTLASSGRFQIDPLSLSGVSSLSTVRALISFDMGELLMTRLGQGVLAGPHIFSPASFPVRRPMPRLPRKELPSLIDRGVNKYHPQYLQHSQTWF